MASAERTKRYDLILRIALPALAVACFGARFLPYSYPGPDDVRGLFNTTLADHASSIVLVALLLANALGLGSAIRRRLGLAGGPLVAEGLGLGVLALAIFLLGNLTLHPLMFLGILAVPPAIFAPAIRNELTHLAERANSYWQKHTTPTLLMILFVAVALLLNAIWAFFPPLDYDVLEYHLGAPAQYLHDGHIHFLQHNVYANMPSNMEMLYLFALGIKGDLLHGAALARLINVTMGLLAACATGLLARKLSGSPLAGLIAAAGFYLFPWTLFLSMQAYVELGMIFFALLALSAFFDYVLLDEKRSVILAGLFAGLAAGVKYPALLFLVLPLGLAAMFVSAYLKDWKAGFTNAAVFGVAALLVLSPWLLRNAEVTGNPTYPLLYSVFGGKDWSPEQNAKWSTAHRPRNFGWKESYSSIYNFVWHPDLAPVKAATPDQPSYVKPLFATLLWLPLAGILACTSPKQKWSWLLVAYAVLCVVFWYVLTHRMPRFLAPWVMISIAPAAYTAARSVALIRTTAYAGILATFALWLGVVLYNHVPGLGLKYYNALGMLDERTMLTRLTEPSTFSHFSYPAISYLNSLPTGSKVLMIGEAETFYTTTDFVSATVFNINPLVTYCNTLESPEDVLAALRKDGITHIFINLPETQRLRHFYSFKFNGKKQPGYWDLTERGRHNFQTLLRDHATLAKGLGWPIPLSSYKPEDRQVYASFTGGSTVLCAGNRCLPYSHLIYRLKADAETGS